MDKIDRAMLLKMMDDDQDQETQNQAVDLAKKDENIEFWNFWNRKFWSTDG